MHPDILRSLDWANNRSRRRLVDRLVSAGNADVSDRETVQLIGLLRSEMRAAGGSMKKMNRALKEFKETHNLSNNKLTELCKMAKICVRDGMSYPDLPQKLAKGTTFRVPKNAIKKYEHVRRCMLHARA
tara:strand:+ start:363 stop:749 length:387 start_codon:yes stop_codon:yes gene_type:complete